MKECWQLPEMPCGQYLLPFLDLGHPKPSQRRLVIWTTLHLAHVSTFK